MRGEGRREWGYCEEVRDAAGGSVGQSEVEESKREKEGLWRCDKETNE